MENIKFNRKLISTGGSKALTLPEELVKFLDIDVGDELIVIPDKGKHGKFIAVFKE